MAKQIWSVGQDSFLVSASGRDDNLFGFIQGDKVKLSWAHDGQSICAATTEPLVLDFKDALVVVTAYARKIAE